MKNVIDFLLDRLNTTTLFEMAFDRKTILDRTRGYQIPINEHLIKILRYKDDINLNKHIEDLETWLLDVQDLDYLKNNKKLKKEDYFKVLFTEPITNVENVQYIKNKEKGKLKNYQNLPKIRTPEETLEMLCSFHKEISELLSKNEIMDFFVDLKEKIKGY